VVPAGTALEAEPDGLRVLWVVLAVAGPAVLAELLATKVFRDYGFALFTFVPVAVGVATAILYNWGRPWRTLETIGVESVAFLVAGLASLLVSAEGAYCLLLALPLVWVLGLIGLFFGWLVKLANARNQTMLLLLGALVPFTMAFEHAVKPLPPLLVQTTTIEVDAPPEVVWRYVPAFPKIETAPTGLLSLDMAYPVASEMTGSGVGASRSCVLSTGVMPEIVTVWEPGRRLEFDVLSTPPAMTETNPFGHTETAHVEGYFKVRRGRFLLTALPGGRTRIEGTSWFEHDLWPQSYWAPLTRRVVREVHLRVFEHIKQLAEKDARQ